MSIAILTDIPDSFIPETKYVLENLFFPFNEKIILFNKPKLMDLNEFKRQRKKIVYCYEESSLLPGISENRDTIYTVLEKKTLDYFSDFQPYNTENIIFSNRTEHKIPCLFPLKKNIQNSAQSNVFKFDLFAAAFFFLSCWQEYPETERDAHGRFSLKKSIQFKTGVCNIPVVNEYLKIFEEYAKKVWDVELDYVELPGAGDLYVTLSHDIDYIDWSLTKYLDELRKNRSIIEKTPSALFNILKNIFSKKEIFRKIKDIEIKHGAASTNFFFSNYPGNQQAFSKNLIASLENSNFEVGHHISETLNLDISLKKDKALFGSLVKKTYGERVHMLKFEINRLFSQLEKCCYLYDNSLLFPEDFSYRTGFSYPHYLYDPFNKRPFNVLAIPLNIMDTTFFEKKYLGLSEKDAFKEISLFIKKSVSYNGVFSVLFHHSLFWFNTKNRLEMYEKFLETLIASNIKIGTCRDIYLWYQEMSCNVDFRRV